MIPIILVILFGCSNKILKLENKIFGCCFKKEKQNEEEVKNSIKTKLINSKSIVKDKDIKRDEQLSNLPKWMLYIQKNRKKH
jgi:hypothetical protein